MRLAGPIPDADATIGGRRLASLLAQARNCTVLTGAGLSTESGVPDFRSPGSPWLVNTPIPFSAFTTDMAARREAWRRKFVMDDIYAHARPARGHHVVRELALRGPVDLVVTQNIDGLHQAAGLPADRLVEIHGNGTYAACLACGERHELAPLRTAFETDGDVPGCRDCGGLVKSATITFGQTMPRDRLARAIRAARDCDLFLVLGCSLLVHPAAQLPILARESGAVLAIVTMSATPADGIADLLVRADLGDTLSACALEMDLDISHQAGMPGVPASETGGTGA
jgi:NAD-dependent deacetylase